MTQALINDMKRSEFANALALHDFAKRVYHLKGWVAYTVELFRNYGLEPTRMGISAPSSKSGKMKTYIREVKKLETINNTAIEGITLQATINGSDDSHNDQVFTAIFSIGLESKITTCTLVFDNALIPLHMETWNNITQNMSKFFQPRYGYCFQRSYKKGPEYYSFGTSCNLQYGDSESEYINCWDQVYHTGNGKYRTGDLRDIYPLNVLSSAHNERIVEGKQLFDWINADSNHGTLTKLADNLWSWWVGDEQIDSVRAALKPTGILLCAP